jgi:serine/threonine-protein kinase
LVKPLNGDGSTDAFLAKVPGAEEPKVLRVLKPELQADDVHVEGILAAAQKLRAVGHPGLIRIVGAGRMSDGRFYLLSDFEEGESLQSRGILAVPSLVEMAVPVCDALVAVHDAGQAMGTLTARDVLITGHGPKLDLAAGLMRKSSRTPDGDVRAFSRVLQALAAPGGEKSHLETALRELGEQPSAKKLKTSLEGLKNSWSGVTNVSPLGSSETPTTIEEVEPDLSGATIGQYRLESILGEGAMGRVYLGKHVRIGRTAAIKVLKTEHARHKDLVQRFIQEATAVNAIKNEHIVEVYDFGEELKNDGSSRVFCVMELLEGIALVDEMAKAPLSVKRIVTISQHLARALGAAHALGIVHRDIKPENVFLHRVEGNPDFVKVLDFGVAKLLKPLGDLPVSSTQAGIVIGTPEYMAPEQALGLPTDFRVDLYAVGLVLYELLSGRQPFHADTFGKLVVEITSKSPPRLPDQTPAGEAIPKGLAFLVNKLLMKNPDHRYASAEELAVALEPFVSGDLSKIDPQAVLDDEKAAQAIAPSKAPKMIAALLAVGVLAAGAWFMFLNKSEPAPAPVETVKVEPAPAPTPEPVAAPAKPEQVSLDLASFPAGAKVSRTDTGESLGVTPFKLDLPKGDGKLTLRFEAKDRQSVERDVLLTGNTSLSVELPVKPAATKPSPSGTGKKAVSRDGVVDPFQN